MILKYDANINNEDIIRNIDRITNLIFKLLPLREENGDWVSPLQTILVELAGMSNLFNDQIELFPLLCKLEGLLTLTEEKEFLTFRKTIFECLSILTKVKEKCQL